MVNLSVIFNSFISTASSLSKGVVHEVEHVTSAVIHAVEAPVAGIYGEGKKVASGVSALFDIGKTMTNVAMITAAGYVSWELVRYVAPDWSSEVSDIITGPFKKRRRVA